MQEGKQVHFPSGGFDAFHRGVNHHSHLTVAAAVGRMMASLLAPPLINPNLRQKDISLMLPLAVPPASYAKYTPEELEL